MTRHVSVVVMLAIVSHTALGQGSSPAGLSIGFDILKTMPIFYSSGYVLEPSLIYTTKNGIMIDMAVGFANVKKDTLYQNSTYFNQGHYLRLGAGGMILKHPGQFRQIYLLADVVYSDFTERFKVRFRDEGNYYGDAFRTLEQSSRLVALEVQPGYRLPIGNSRFSVNFQARFSYVVTEYDEDNFPVYLIPGVGCVGTEKDRPYNNTATVGASIRIVYKLLENNN